MVLAVLNDTGFNIVLFLHILFMVVGFAPAFVWPFVSVNARKSGASVSGIVGKVAAGSTRKIFGPALAFGGIMGFGVIGMANRGAPGDFKYFEFSDWWISLGILAWFVALGVQFLLIAPAEDAMAAAGENGDAEAEKKFSMAYGILHLVLAVALYAMVFGSDF